MYTSWTNLVLGNMKLLTSMAVLLATVTLCSGALVKPPSGSGNFELLILHNNDMHARFEQTSRLSGACTAADRDEGKCYGGFPRVAHVVKEARMAAQSGQGPPVLYLNAGDTYTGTAWFTIYKWKIAAEFINALQPDAVSLDNNGLKEASRDLSPFLKNIHTKILASNVVLKSAETNENLQKSIIIDVEGVKVGIVGYLTPSPELLDTAGDVEYIDEVIALKDEVGKLQALDVSVIIALGHSTLKRNIEIATEVDGLDLVIAGQNNKLHRDGINTNGAAIEPVVVTQKSGTKVSIIPSFSYSKYLGKVITRFNTEGEIINYSSEPVLLDSTVNEDEEALQIVRSHISELTARPQRVIGKTAVVLDGDSCKTEECNIGNLITDAITYYHATKFEGTSPWTDASIAIIPAGDIGRSIAPSNRPADITLEDLLLAMPIESDIVAVTMNGTVLNEVLEHSVATYSTQNPTGQLLQFSGIRAEYDLSKESGSRLVNAFARCSSCFVPEFFVIESSRTYKVLMPAFMADGAYGYSMLVGLVKEKLEYDEFTCTMEFIGLRSPVHPEVAGRLVLHNSEGVEENGAGSLTSTITTVALLQIAAFYLKSH